jgi:hypothetical protein
MNTNNKPLKIFDKQELYHYVYGVKTLGKNPEMEGNCSGLWGDCSRLRGNCTGLRGDLDLITTKQREENSYILFYGEVQS